MRNSTVAVELRFRIVLLTDPYTMTGFCIIIFQKTFDVSSNVLKPIIEPTVYLCPNVV